MKTQSIVVILDTHEIYTPEQIVFKTIFLLHQQHTLPTDLPLMNAHFLRFLGNNNLIYNGPQPMNMNHNGFAYSCPSYLITLTHPAYLLLENYRDEHPELTGYVISSVFSKDDQDRFIQSLTVTAKRIAEEKAQKQGLMLTDTFEMEEVKIDPKGWTVHPPLQARFNHFRQTIGGHYKFYFSGNSQ